jgi:hypothetical protein
MAVLQNKPNFYLILSNALRIGRGWLARVQRAEAISLPRTMNRLDLTASLRIANQGCSRLWRKRICLGEAAVTIRKSA